MIKFFVTCYMWPTVNGTSER